MLLRKVAGLVVAVFLLGQTGCRNHSANDSSGDHPADKAVAAGDIQLIFSYGSEKQKWIEDVTAAFNQSGAKTTSGKHITVKAVAKGSGECIEDLLSGSEQDDLTSPASNVFIKLGNAKSRASTGHDFRAISPRAKARHREIRRSP